MIYKRYSGSRNKNNLNGQELIYQVPVGKRAIIKLNNGMHPGHSSNSPISFNMVTQGGDASFSSQRNSFFAIYNSSTVYSGCQFIIQGSVVFGTYQQNRVTNTKSINIYERSSELLIPIDTNSQATASLGQYLADPTILTVTTLLNEFILTEGETVMLRGGIVGGGTGGARFLINYDFTVGEEDNV